MGNDWLKKKCEKGCGGTVFYLAKWIVAPKYCDRCRLAEIDDLSGLLEKFLARETKIERKMRTPLEKRVFAERGSLRAKVGIALRKGRHNLDQLSKECLREKDILHLLFHLDKEERLDKRPDRGSKHVLPKSLAPFLQGGAPGLGKRS